MMSDFLVETPRLRMRNWQADDRPAFARMVADAEMMRYLSAGRAWREDEIDEFFARQARHYAKHGFCMGALVLKETDEVIGVAGLQPLDIEREFELGWWVWKAHWGNGYATEAGQGLVRYGFEVLGLERLVAVIEPGNAASIRVAENIGMCFERRMSARETVARREDVEIVYYSVKRPGAPIP